MIPQVSNKETESKKSNANMTTSENQIVVNQPNETVRLDVRLENGDRWVLTRFFLRESVTTLKQLDEMVNGFLK